MSKPWQVVEAMLFASPQVVSTERLAAAADLAPSEVKACIAKLNRDYEAGGRAFEIREVADGWQMVTRSNFAPWIARLVQRRGRDLLSKAALEALAVIAHRQPINKPDIDQTRGIDSSYILASLFERGLVRIKGRDRRAGHPYVYVTTPKFLEYFGLKSLEDLPDLEEPALKEEDIMPLEEGAAGTETQLPIEGREGEGAREAVDPEALSAIGYRISSDEDNGKSSNKSEGKNGA